MTILERILMLSVGGAFIGGAYVLGRGAMDAKNLISCSLFALCGLAMGLFLIINAFTQP